MDQEINIPPEYKDVVAEIISIEEIQQFFVLHEKMAKAEAAVANIQKQANDLLDQKKEFTGPVPYTVTLTLMSDVVIPSADENIAPEQIEKRSQSYLIEFIDNGYNVLIDRIYDKLTNVITAACKELVKSPEDKNDVNIETTT
jgi:hypothetical protein